MKIITLLALAMALGGGVGRAEEAMASQKPAHKMYLGITRHEKGTVVAVDAAADTITVKNKKGKVWEFSVKTAKIDSAEGKTITLADIVIGDEVSIAHKGKKAIEVLRMQKAEKY